MNIKELLKEPFTVLVIITLLITSYLLFKQFYIGVPYYDVFVYLNNALIFAGIPVGNVSVIYLSPLMPFLTSLIFRAGYISANAMFVLNAIVFVFGVLGLYLLLRERFNQMQSFTGSIIFISLPLIFTWAVSGGIDIPGISLSIWTIYLLVLGVKRDSKYLYLVFPVLMVAFLARYTSVILVFPIFLYLIISNNLLKNFKKLFVGIMASLVLFIPFMAYFYAKLGNITPLINLVTSTIMGAGGAVNDLGYNPDKLYFLFNMLNYINIGPLQGVYRQVQNPSQGYPSILAYILVIIVLVGLAICIYRIIKRKIENIDNKGKTVAQVILLILLLAMAVWSFFYSSYLVCEVITLASLYVAYRILKGTEKNLEIDFLFLSWFIAFFIFHSIIPLKVDRYFITMSPALVYFLVLGLSTVIEKYKSKLTLKKFKGEYLYLIISFLLLFSTLAVHVGHTPRHGYGYQIQAASDWLTSYDPNYMSKAIYSDYDPALSWSLKKEVKFAVPRIYVGPDSFARFLLDNNVDYYIDAYTDPKWNIPGYHIIKTIGGVAIYQRNS
ncbi:MAG TPA: glycosyltransferase family 39 protein [Methanobacterium sp.]|nr:glycosyltransferase family 39 protein [Methanobacterium sp.]